MFIENNKYSEGDIASFKLLNGDEVVAKIIEDSGLEYKLERPCTVVPSQKGIMLIASLFTAEPDMTVRISKSHVILHAPTAKEVRNHYIQITTGIQTVPAGSIVTGL
jgi:hypothetical protein